VTVHSVPRVRGARISLTRRIPLNPSLPDSFSRLSRKSKIIAPKPCWVALVNGQAGAGAE